VISRWDAIGGRSVPHTDDMAKSTATNTVLPHRANVVLLRPADARGCRLPLTGTGPSGGNALG